MVIGLALCFWGIFDEGMLVGVTLVSLPGNDTSLTLTMLFSEG